jgi:nitrite reductase/ring-hydroxylating ferredoxin subunit
MNIKGLLATAAMAAGLAIGLAANVNAAPVSDDFWECVADHQDTDGIGVCCVFYGGDYDERTGECWIDHEAAASPASVDIWHGYRPRFACIKSTLVGGTVLQHAGHATLDLGSLQRHLA